MGDGRYYTMTQFGAVVWLTLLIFISIIMLINSYYKIENKWRQISLSGLVLIVALFSHFIAEVIPLEMNYAFFLQSKNILFITFGLLSSYYLLITYNAKDKRQIKWMILSLLILLLAALTWFFVPSIWWLYEGLFVLQFVLLADQLTSSSLGVNLFTDIKKVVLDYVIITNAGGHVAYASEQVINSPFFDLQSKMSIADISSFFVGDVTLRESFAKQFIRLRTNQNYYFQFNKKEIYSNNKLGGYILTFVDISDLIALLDDYEAKREAVFKSNVRLRRYKDKVYQIEREKEVNHLLREIAENQEKSLVDLNHDIAQLALEDENFQSKIDDLIARAKANLNDVRQAVTTYKNYYGEGK